MKTLKFKLGQQVRVTKIFVKSTSVFDKERQRWHHEWRIIDEKPFYGIVIGVRIIHDGYASKKQFYGYEKTKSRRCLLVAKNLRDKPVYVPIEWL